MGESCLGGNARSHSRPVVLTRSNQTDAEANGLQQQFPHQEPARKVPALQVTR